MHDLSFFLLKNWLPVGVSAIVFFSIGLLLARMTWGRYTQRLSYAVEENMNLASQWSSLGSSQRDLFKKLRVRWQSDRDSWEMTLAEKEHRIATLTHQLTSSGKEIPEALLVDHGLKAKIKELEAALDREKTAYRQLREVSETGPVVGPVATAMAAAAPAESAEAVAATEFQARIRDLEQDLIDTHDELHDVRAQYQKQLALVESLEAKLIENPAGRVEDELVIAIEKIAGLEARLEVSEGAALAQAAEVAQWKALLPQRGREMRGLRSQFLSLKKSGADAISELKSEFTAKEEAAILEKEVILAAFAAKEQQLLSEREFLISGFDAEKETLISGFDAEKEALISAFDAEKETLISGFDEKEKALALGAESLKADFAAQEEALLAAHLSEKTALEENIAFLSEEVAQRREEIEAMEADLLAKSAALDEAAEKITELEIVQRRKVSLQAELNDACHEMYDVRRALNLRLADIALLESRLAELVSVESRNGELLQDLDATREELAAALQSNRESAGQINDLSEGLTDLRHALSERSLESESLQSQLTDARHELSDVRIAYNASVSDHQRALAQMEELEAIIEDRNAEVNDLSSELRTQRDLVRQLKNTLAQAEGELEALNDESRILNAGITSKTAFVEEQTRRITDLEIALGQRYHELNAVRAEADGIARHVRYHEARTRHLEAGLERRLKEAAENDKQMASVEGAFEAANMKITALTEQLEESSTSLAQLQQDLQLVSQEKEDTLRDLDLANGRLAQSEEAAAVRETQLGVISQELSESIRVTSDLEIMLNRLNTELETAREEQEASRLSIAELEGSLRASDERTLALSSRLEEKEAGLATLLAELETLRVSIEAREASEAAAIARLEELQAGYESMLVDAESALAAADEERELLTKQQREEVAQLTSELETMRETIAGQTARLESGAEQRDRSQAELEALQGKLEQRSDSIRELQDQLSAIILQRASRDIEISDLKEKLLAVEIELSEARQSEAAHSEAFLALSAERESPTVSESLVDEACLAAAIHRSLTAEVSGEEEGISLDEIVIKTTHHHPQVSAPTVVAPLVSSGKKAGAGIGDDHTVYFNEGNASLSTAELEKIDLCARAIRRFGRKVEVTVIGYAGSEGNPDQTERISARRADAVRERLLEKGVSQNLVTVRGSGQDRRFSDWKARRVEMIVVPVAIAEAVN
jgi:chromosome segregation ATPase/outer membrane protein OmpA-like peptidoglycan-associated protein